MFWFHQDRPEAGDRSLRAGFQRIFPRILWKKAHRKPGERQVEVSPGGLVEDGLGEGRRSLGRGGAGGPKDDVELGRSCRSEEVRRFVESFVEVEGCSVARFEALRE